ncbi:MAG: 6-bladed beta-propeller [Candidatus Aminicenantes bacterium]|nr:6-bladed beta-propeller [Candidatus Aminicenantes bacterium]
MVKHYKGFHLLLIFTLAFLAFSCAKKQGVWQGKIETKDGVTIVTNPKEPVHGSEAISFREDLSLGGEEATGEYMFAGVMDIEVDAGDNIYVLDRDEAHIQVFDEQGAFIRTIGSPGAGPGEISNPWSFCLKNDTLTVASMDGRMSLFTTGGEFVRVIQTGFIWIFQLAMDSLGNYYMTVPNMSENAGITTVINKYDQEFKSLQQMVETPGMDRQGVIKVFRPMLYWEMDKDDNIVYGYPENYEVNIINTEGKPYKKITRPCDPIPVSEEEKERYGDAPQSIKFEFSKNHAAYKNFFLDDEGRVYVRTFEKDLEGTYLYDVFDAEGKFMAKFPLKGSPAFIKRSKLYLSDEDEGGYPLVKRFHVTWNIK